MQDDLSRAASALETANALAALTPGNLTAAAGQITHALDHYRQFVTNGYQQYLGRPPDAAGLSAWVGKMQAGLTDEQLEAAFIGAPEYIAAHGGAGAGWVQGLYHDILVPPFRPKLGDIDDEDGRRDFYINQPATRVYDCSSLSAHGGRHRGHDCQGQKTNSPSLLSTAEAKMEEPVRDPADTSDKSQQQEPSTNPKETAAR
jgi:hypothetical protein